MNTTTTGSDHRSLGSPPLSGLGYTLGPCLGVLITFAIVTYLSYTCKRVRDEAGAIRNLYSSDDITDRDYGVITFQDKGLDEATISSFPRFTYSNLKSDDSTTISACSVCLADYIDDDFLRLLPECGHFFHVGCIDQWLVVQSSCPVCRSSPLPAPLAPAASDPI